MARYAYDGETVTLYLTNNDVDLLDSLAEQLIEMLSDGLAEAVETEDPFVRWEAELEDPPEVPDELVDPAMQRLFPNPYPHDARAAADYRRFAEADHRRQKLDDARVLRRTLADGLPVRISDVQVEAWLKTLNALRLVLATRLGLDDEEALTELHRLRDDDPRVMMGAIMDWLAYIQGVIIELTEPGLDE